MKNTSEINQKLEIMFDYQHKLQLETNVHPEKLQPYQRAIYIAQCWSEAVGCMARIRKMSVKGLYETHQAQAMTDYTELFTWIVNIGIYLGLDPELLFNIYKFKNEERRHGIHS